MPSWHPNVEVPVDRQKASRHLVAEEAGTFEPDVGQGSRAGGPGVKEARLTRLFLAHGEPTTTPEQRRMLRECEHLLVMVDIAALCLGAAIQNDDVELCIESCRRLQSLGFLLGEHARLSS